MARFFYLKNQTNEINYLRIRNIDASFIDNCTGSGKYQL